MKKTDIILLVTSQLFETQLRPSQALSPLLRLVTSQRSKKHVNSIDFSYYEY